MPSSLAMLRWFHVFLRRARFGCEDDGDEEEDDAHEVDDANHEGVIVLRSYCYTRCAYSLLACKNTNTSSESSVLCKSFPLPLVCLSHLDADLCLAAGCLVPYLFPNCAVVYNYAALQAAIQSDSVLYGA